MDYKVLIIGNTGVGKTSILVRYTSNEFVDNIPATVGIDYQTKDTTYNNEAMKLQIWDTAGQERYQSITTAYYRGGHGFLIVFNLTNKDSFSNLDRWIKTMHENADPNVPFVLIGNKSDMKDQRVVTAEEAQQYAASVGADYFETSSKNNTNIKEAFDALMKKMTKPAEEEVKAGDEENTKGIEDTKPEPEVTKPEPDVSKPEPEITKSEADAEKPIKVGEEKPQKMLPCC